MSLVLTALLDGSHDRPDAVRVGEQACSHAALLDGALRVAAGVHARDDEGPLAVHAAPSLGTITTVVGGLLAGVPVVPVPPDSGPAEREHVLRDSRATTWAGPTALAPDLRPVPDVGRAAEPAPGHAGDPDATALVLYTSGTTGAPKGVEISGAALAAGLDALADAWAWSADDVLVHGLPLFHLHGLVLGVLGPLRRGSRLVHTVRPTPEAYAEAASSGGSLFFGVPTVWHRVVQSATSTAALRGARLLVSGSAPLPLPTFEALAAATGHTPIERYGMTETGITLSTRVDGERRPGWVGQPVGSTRTRLRDDHGDDVAPDGATVARLEVSGPTLFRGYLGRPDATAESLTDDGWFRTGDLAVADADGFHRIVGRESVDLIKSGGYRIGAGEVEAVLLEHPAVEEVAVIGRPDPDLGQRIVAFVVTDASPHGRDGLAEALIELVATRLSHHKRPRDVVLVDTLPRNAMGKVQKTLLA